MSRVGMGTPEKTPNKQKNPTYIAIDERTKTTTEIIFKKAGSLLHLFARFFL